MASVFKAKKSDLHYTIMYFNEHGVRCKRKGYSDKRSTQEYASRLESVARKIKNGDIDPQELKYREHQAKPLSEHLADYERYLIAKGSGEKHSQSTVKCAKRLLELGGARRISDISFSATVDALNIKAMRVIARCAGSVTSKPKPTARSAR